MARGSRLCCLLILASILAVTISAGNDVDSSENTGSTTGISAEAVKWKYGAEHLETFDFSKCYLALTYGIINDNEGRILVTETETVQFSVGLNKTFLNSEPVFNNSDCSSLWVRVVLRNDYLETSTLVDSSTNPLEPETTYSRILHISKHDAFPQHNFVRGVFVGFADLEFHGLAGSLATNETLNVSVLSESDWVTFSVAKVATLRKKRAIDFIFQIIIFCLIILGNAGIGLNVNWKEMREVIKRPIGPIIGFCCQYIIMPLTAFGVVNMIDLPADIALGVFLIGCAPGGGGSNYHTYFLGGSLPLSVTMTFVSTICAVGMMPLWVFTLGKLVLSQSKNGVTLDFKGILGALFTSIVPFLIGIFINWRRRELAKRIFNVFVRPLLFLIFLYLISIGMYTNLYIFRLMRPKVLLAGVCLPYVGFTLGFTVAMVAKQGRAVATTIAVETGIQSTGIAITTLMLSLPLPDADIAIVGPLSVTMFTPIPLWIAEISRGVYLCIKRRRCFIFDSCRKRGDDFEESSEDEKEDHEATGFNTKLAPPSDLNLAEASYDDDDDDDEKPEKQQDQHSAAMAYPPNAHFGTRESALQPLLEPVIESPISEQPSSPRDKLNSTASEASTLVPPDSAPVSPTEDMQAESQSDEGSFYDNNVSDDTVVVAAINETLVMRDPRDSIYYDAAENW